VPPQYVSAAQFTAPAAADGASITPNATAWANSTYVTLLAATDAAAVLTGIVVFPTTNLVADFDLDIATGAAGAEVVIATVKGTANSNQAFQPIRLPIPIDNIASGARLSARLRKVGTDVNLWRVAVTYLKKPLTGTLQTTASRPLVVPAAAALVNLPSSGGTAWVTSAWTTMIASTATAIVLTHVVGRTNGDSSSAGFELDIGTGTAGAEVLLTTVRRFAANGTGGPWVVALASPLDNIASGVRVAVRWRGPTFTTPTCGLIYLAKPL
jgi:hypothetical protein